MTLRADGHSVDHVAFGGPIFYGHAASGFHEEVHHPGNVFCPQAMEANKVYQMLDPKQQAQALVESARRARSASRATRAMFPGIPVKESADEQRRSCKR